MNKEFYFIGQMLTKPDIAYKTIIKDKHIFSTQARLYFATIKHLLKEGIEVDEMTLHTHNNELQLSDIMRLKDAVTTTANWEWYEQQILENYKRTEIKKVCEKVIKDKVSPSRELIKEIMQVVDFSENDDTRVVDIRESVIQTTDYIEECIKEGKKLAGVSTGIVSLDDKISGFQNRRLYIVGARPSDGKTALLMNFVLNANESVGVISAESSHQELTTRLISLSTKMDSEKLTSGIIKTGQMDVFTEMSEKLANKQIYYYDEPNLHLDTLLLKAREMKQRYDIKALYIDYIQIIQYDDRDRKNEQVAHISSSLKGLARKLNIPVIAAAQLRRPDKQGMPELHDLGESGQIERDADCVMMIYHEEENQTKLILAKNRDGAKGITRLLFKKEYYGFFDIERKYD